MAKRSWKQRWSSIKDLSVEEKIAWLRTSRISPRLARELYEQTVAGPHDWHASHLDAPLALDLIRWCLLRLDPQFSVQPSCRPGWIKPFLWRELLAHKADVLGEVIAEVGYLFVADDRDSAGRLMDLYEDEDAHRFTRGNVLYSLMFARIPEDQEERLQRTVRHALTNKENAYARCTGCMLATCDPTIRPSDIEPLLTDEEGLKPGWNPPVKQYARSAYDQISQDYSRAIQLISSILARRRSPKRETGLHH